MIKGWSFLKNDSIRHEPDTYGIVFTIYSTELAGPRGG